MDALVKILFGTSPKTSISGLFFGVVTALIPLLQNMPADSGVFWGFLAMALGFVVQGRLQKDADKTGV